jgi:hypothetical protein
VAVNSINLEALADSFDVELYAGLLLRDDGLRGLKASHASKSSPFIVVPMSSALVVADPGIPEGYQYILDSPLCQVLPSGLQALMMGVIPETYGLWNLQFVQLAAVLLWLRSSKPSAAPSTVGSQVHGAWQEYIEQVSVGCLTCNGSQLD